LNNKIDFDVYFDKALGGWTGKSLGGTIGWFEGIKKITDFTIDDVLPEQVLANDDLDVQLVWMDALLTKGVYVTGDQLMEAWIGEYKAYMGEYGYSKRNYARGVRAPQSGVYGNSFFKTGMGCPIRSEIWGMICPGNPELAAEYARRDGTLDHEGESVWAEQFLAAIEAEAFFEKDVYALISRNMRFAPESSRLYACVRDAVKGFEAGLPWQKTWELLRDGHSHPDCTYAPFNLGIIALALLYGRGDFEDTLTISVNGGWDTDCTCATCGAVLGIINGNGGFDKKWLDLAGDKVVTSAKTLHEMNSLRQLAEYTCMAGITICREGLNSLEIVCAPELATGRAPFLPAARQQPDIEFAVEYNGYPAIGADETKKITLTIGNNSGAESRGVISIAVPDGWKAEYGKTPFDIAPRGKTAVDITIRADVADKLYDTNIINAIYTDSAGRRSRHDFGLCGAPACMVAGPFFDSYMEWTEDGGGAAPVRRRLRSRNSGEYGVPLANGAEEWCNHRVDIDKEYVAEDFSRRIQTENSFAGCKRVNIYDDAYSAKDAFGLQGPCCLYYYQEVHSPCDRRAILYSGSSDPYKIWLNGSLIYAQKDCRFWMPLNDNNVVDLKEGVNRIVIKTVRCGADNRFSMVFREYRADTPARYDVTPFITDLAYGAFLPARNGDLR